MKTNRILRAGLVAGLGLASTGAWATPCTSALSSYEFYVQSGLQSNAADIVSNHPECFAGSPTRSLMMINATSFVLFYRALYILALRRMFQSPFAPYLVGDSGERGMAAGGTPGKWNFWSNLEQSDTRQTYMAANGFRTKNESDITTIVFGGDYALSKDLTLGLSAAYDDGNGSGSNRSPGSAPNGIQTDGYLVAPYLSWQFARDWSLDASAGFGHGRMGTTSNTDVTGSRWFAAANLGYSRWVGNWQLSGQASLMRGVEDYNDIKNSTTGVKFVGTDAKNTLDRFRIGAQAGYWLNGMMPYVSLAYTDDVGRKTTQFGVSGNPVGRDAFILGAGLNFYSVKDGVTGGVGYSQEFGRNNQTHHSVTANINLRF